MINPGVRNPFYNQKENDDINFFRTQFDFNRYAMYLLQHTMRYFKASHGIKNVNELYEKIVKHKKDVWIPKKSFIEILNNRAYYPVCEYRLIKGLKNIGVDLLEIAGAAAEDYMEECMYKFKLLEEGYEPRTYFTFPKREEGEVINLLVMRGDVHFSYKGKQKTIRF